MFGSSISDILWIRWTKSCTTFKVIIGNHCLLVVTGESSFQGFLGGAGFGPSTVEKEVHTINIFSICFAEIARQFTKNKRRCLGARASLDVTHPPVWR